MGLRERSTESGRNPYGTEQASFDGGISWSSVGDWPPGTTGTRHTYQSMTDFTSRPPYPDHPWLTHKYTSSPPRLNGTEKLTVTGVLHRYQDRSYYNACEPYPYAPAPVTPFYAAELMTAALANMNPSSAAVDLPLFLFEFKDFPGMLKNLGDILAKRIKPGTGPDTFLAYQFGWAPLLSDLNKLLNMQKLIDDRLAYLKKYAGEGGRVSRRLKSGTIAHPGGSIDYHQTSSWEWIRMTLTDSEDFTSWFCADLKINIQLPKRLDEQKALAARAAFGLNNPAATIWNAIPWSFLTDYFFNIGDFLEATAGLIPHSVSRVCLMQKNTRTRILSGGNSANGISISSGKQTVVRCDRAASPLPIPMILPRVFLTKNQLMNMAGLATSAALKGR